MLDAVEGGEVKPQPKLPVGPSFVVAELVQDPFSDFLHVQQLFFPQAEGGGSVGLGVDEDVLLGSPKAQRVDHEILLVFEEDLIRLALQYFAEDTLLLVGRF